MVFETNAAKISHSTLLIPILNIRVLVKVVAVQNPSFLLNINVFRRMFCVITHKTTNFDSSMTANFAGYKEKLEFHIVK